MAVDYGLSISQAINFGTPSAIQNVAVKTICCWLDLDSANISDVINLAQAAGTDEAWSVFFRSDSGIKIAFQVSWSTTDGRWEVSTAWGTGKHFFAMTYDRGSTSNKPTFYKDGVSVSRTDVATPAGTVRSGTNNTLYLGSGGVLPSVDGRKQDVRVYSRALSAAEIAALYASSRTIEMNDSSLVFHAPLMYAANRYPTVPFAGTLGGTDYTYDRINNYQGTPAGSPSGSADIVYGTSF